ncbi:MAG TPA: response regulator [Puia sp.]|nr:response regulator [Puia sp.]
MNRKTIMLVEDDELDVISVQRSLKKLEIDFELVVAFNGAEAIEMLQGSSRIGPMGSLPDIVLLDLNMPRMNGLEFLQRIRADPRLAHIKVFVMTTSGESADRSSAEALGVSGYLVKPMSYGAPYNRKDSMEHFVQFHMRSILLGLEE